MPALEQPRQRPKAPWLVAFTLLVLSAAASGAAPARLFDALGLENAAALVSGLLRPDLSADFVQRVLILTLESLLIGCQGLALALAFALPLCLCASKLPELPEGPDQASSAAWFGALPRQAARAILSVLRAIPEIIWAYLFVRILGLGPGPAIIAIGLSFGGTIGKLYAELLESVDPAPVLALRARGASRLAALLYGGLPQVASQWLRYGLFRFECGLRSASILGVVGAGGLGAEIDLSLRYFQYDKLGTSLAAVLLLVLSFECLSLWLQHRRARLPLALLAGGVTLAWLRLDVPWLELGSADARLAMTDFLQGLLDPRRDAGFLWESLKALGETIAMAFAATGFAALIAFCAAPLAARGLSAGSALRDGHRRRGLAAAGALAAFTAARAAFQLSRALPELCWALLFVVWVGPGPFAGLLAVTAHTTGVLGRLFAEVYEQVEPAPLRALEARGASPFARFLFAVIPSAAPRLCAYALFRFEVNLRLTAMVGFVGAGGLGDALHSAISLFHTRELASLLLLLVGAVAMFDAIGDRLRRRLLRAGQTATRCAP